MTLAFFIAQRLLGLLVATVGFLLIAFDPFHIALSRMLHIDGTEANFVCLALLAFLAYLLGGRQRRYLILSGVAAGLAWLTKVPALFLAPFVGLLLLLEFGQTWWQTRQFQGAALLRTIGIGLIWGVHRFCYGCVALASDVGGPDWHLAQCLRLCLDRGEWAWQADLF